MLINCILWGNSAFNGNEIFNSASATVSYSIVQGGIGTNACCQACIDGGDNLYFDPLFVDVPNNDLRVFVGSPAINAGDNAANTTSRDLAGK